MLHNSHHTSAQKSSTRHPKSPFSNSPFNPILAIYWLCKLSEEVLPPSAENLTYDHNSQFPTHHLTLSWLCHQYYWLYKLSMENGGLYRNFVCILTFDIGLSPSDCPLHNVLVVLLLISAFQEQVKWIHNR